MTWLSWSQPGTRPPTPGVMKLTISVDYYSILSLSDLCQGPRKEIFIEIMHFHHMTYMDTP